MTPGAGGGNPYAAHGGPAAAPGPAASGEKPSTEEWLGGLASGIFGGEASQSQAGAPGAAHGEGGDAPDVPGYPGVAAGSPYDTPGASGAAAKQYEAGTAENAVQRLVLKLQAGDTTGYEEIISDKTKDAILAPLRDGKIDAATLAKAKEMSGGASLLNIRDSAGSKLFMVRNGAGQTLTITTKREAGGYKVTGLKVDTPRGRRR